MDQETVFKCPNCAAPISGEGLCDCHRNGVRLPVSAEPEPSLPHSIGREVNPTGCRAGGSVRVKHENQWGYPASLLAGLILLCFNVFFIFGDPTRGNGIILILSGWPTTLLLWIPARHLWPVLRGLGWTAAGIAILITTYFYNLPLSKPPDFTVLFNWLAWGLIVAGIIYKAWLYLDE